MTEESGHSAGLLGSLRDLAKTVLAVIQTRLEIFASEIDEQRALLARVAVLSGIAAFCLGLGVILLVLLVAVLFWDTHRLLAIGAMAAFFVAGGIAAGLMLVATIRRRPKLLAATLAELRKDRSKLEGQ
jgi:uncharacterized membrane protein YqjE